MSWIVFYLRCSKFFSNPVESWLYIQFYVNSIISFFFCTVVHTCRLEEISFETTNTLYVLHLDYAQYFNNINIAQTMKNIKSESLLQHAPPLLLVGPHLKVALRDLCDGRPSLSKSPWICAESLLYFKENRIINWVIAKLLKLSRSLL